MDELVKFKKAYFPLSRKQRLSLKVGGRPKVGGWEFKKGKVTPIYAFNCPIHGVVASNLKGYNERLECPKCLDLATKPKKK